MRGDQRLREAVARAIADAERMAPYAEARHREGAAAAVRVVLAEATRSIEAIAWDARAASPPLRVLSLDQVLAVLAALAEEA